MWQRPYSMCLSSGTHCPSSPHRHSSRPILLQIFGVWHYPLDTCCQCSCIWECLLTHTWVCMLAVHLEQKTQQAIISEHMAERTPASLLHRKHQTRDTMNCECTSLYFYLLPLDCVMPSNNMTTSSKKTNKCIINVCNSLKFQMTFRGSHGTICAIIFASFFLFFLIISK